MAAWCPLRTVSVTVIRCDGERFSQEGAADHRHMLQDGIEYSGEKGRLSGVQLAVLLGGQQPGAASLEPLIWGATAVESAWADERLVGFARAFTDGVRFGCIDLVVALPDHAQVRPVLIDRLQRRYPAVPFTLHTEA